jgi:hypothetical protein
LSEQEVGYEEHEANAVVVLLVEIEEIETD